MQIIVKADKRCIIYPNGRQADIRGYRSAANRERAKSQLVRLGFNYFVYYRDTQSDYALQYGWADWAAKQNRVYVDR